MSVQTQETLLTIAYATLVIVSAIYLAWVFKIAVSSPDGGSFRNLPRTFYLGVSLTVFLAALVITLTSKGYVGTSVCLPFAGLPYLAIFVAYNHIEKPKRKPIEEK